MKIKALISAHIVAALIAVFTSVSQASEGASIVIDANNNRVLFHENAFQRWYPASLTKIMTAYVVFRGLQQGQFTLQSPVVISSKAANEPASKMGYKPGSVLTIDNALKLLIVKSANDIAVALAESVAGSENAFAERMNREALRLGMTDTNFVNPNGLHAKGQYSTARDLAILSAAVRREFPQYDDYFSLEGVMAGDKVLRSYNVLLGRYDGADGMKTGFICPSGFNLVGSATRGSRTIIAVVLGSPSQQERTEKAAELLERGFEAGRTAGVRISELKPYGEGRSEAPNMRSKICTKAAQSERWDDRDSNGRMIIRSNLLKPKAREPQTVRIALGGATGPVPEIWPNAPIPTPRPADADASDPALPEPSIAPENTGSIPVPTPREAALRQTP